MTTESKTPVQPHRLRGGLDPVGIPATDGLVPALLVGAERSGTTVLRLMLDHHPQITWNPEFEYSVDRVGDGGVWPSVPAYCEWLATSRRFQEDGFTIDSSLDYPALVSDFLAQRRKRSGKPIVGATVHRHYSRLACLWPKARFIHIVRDPRDVAKSVINMGWAGNVWTGVEEWMRAEKDWERTRSTLSSEDWIEVRYEDLVADTRTTLTRICRFLGVDYHPAMLDYPADTTYKSPDVTLIDQWRKKSAVFEVQLIEARVADMMVERGYSLSGFEPIDVEPWLARWLEKQSRRTRRKHRIERYGLWLVILDGIARRIGPKILRRMVRNRMNTIQWLHLR